MARDTKLGPEEITRDIPNVSEEALKNLDEAGIVYIGAEVQPGDILVGKITPKGESPMTPEEKLLRAIFGEKASDVRDTSMRMPPGHLRYRRRSSRLQSPRRGEGRTRHGDRARGNRTFRQGPRRRAGHSRPQRLRASGRRAQWQACDCRTEGLQEGLDVVTGTLMGEHPRSQWWQFAVEDEKLQGEIEALRNQYDDSKKLLEQRFMDKVEKVQRGDEMPPGVMKMVKVFVAVKRKIQPGDKMAGRHGNKGVVSRIAAVRRYAVPRRRNAC
jgi:DNA-directed RNA polymerase subunit beta